MSKITSKPLVCNHFGFKNKQKWVLLSETRTKLAELKNWALLPQSILLVCHLRRQWESELLLLNGLLQVS